MFKFVLVLLSIAAATIWFFSLRPSLLAGPAGYVIVAGHSMEPTLLTGDLVVTRARSHYEVGDIVAFRVNGSKVIHRIIGGNGVDGFEMLGDNKPAPDSWHPANKDIIGKQWITLPGKGRWLAWAREPSHLSAILGGMAAMTLVGGQKLQDKRRKRGKHMRQDGQSGNGNGAPQEMPAPPFDRLRGDLWAWIGLGATAVLVLALGAVAVKAFTTSPSRSQYVERAKYEQSGAYDYTVVGPRSSLYPDGRIGPIAAPPRVNAAPAAPVAAPPIFTKLAQSIEVGFHYAVAGTGVTGVSGTIGADLQIKAASEGGWTKTQPLVAPVPFQGNAASLRASIDLAPIQATIDTIEKETGFSPGSYDIVVVPRVTAKGSVNGEPLDLAYAPAFTFKYTKTNITPDATLQRSEPKSIGSNVTSSRHLSLALVRLPVSTARPLSAALAVIALGACGLFASVLFLGLGQDEAVKAQVRFHTTMVTVEEARHKRSQSVRVASINDLARVANRDGGVIFTQKLPDGDLYFVPDGSVTYEYSATNGNGKGHA